MIRLFTPILAGATLRDRLGASLGGVAGIAITSAACWWLLRDAAGLPFLAAPIGASAVLVFAVPASPLAQPWSVIGGNVLSAAVGLVVAHLVPVPHVAAGLAVGAAILAMSLCRCLHPPGGAVALTAAIGGPAVGAAGHLFPLTPIGLNAVLLVLAGMGYHRLASRHSYPHKAPAAARGDPVAPRVADVEAALAEVGETFDIDADDLIALVERAHAIAAQRPRAAPTGTRAASG